MTEPRDRSIAPTPSRSPRARHTGLVVRLYRAIFGADQATLGIVSGIHPRLLSDYEREVEVPSPAQLERLASAVKVPLSMVEGFALAVVSARSGEADDDEVEFSGDDTAAREHWARVAAEQIGREVAVAITPSLLAFDEALDQDLSRTASPEEKQAAAVALWESVAPHEGEMRTLLTEVNLLRQPRRTRAFSEWLRERALTAESRAEALEFARLGRFVVSTCDLGREPAPNFDEWAEEDSAPEGRE